MTDAARQFLLMAGLLPLDSDEIAENRLIAAMNRKEDVFAEQVAYLGDMFVEVVAYAGAVSWLIEPTNSPEWTDFILPFWKAVQDECPGMSYFFEVYRFYDVLDCGAHLYRAA